MADILQIYQYQTVDFTDTSTGAIPLTRVWSFPGGTPTTSTITPKNVQYFVPGTYTVTLTETDTYGTTKSLIQSNIIQVSPSSLVAGISGPSPASVKMDEGYQLDDSSSGTPFSPTSWAWSLPYGRSATTQNVGVTGYGDWNTLTGTYAGNPGAIYTGNISLTSSVTISGYTLTSTSSTTVDVSKLGPLENLYLNATGSSSGQYVTGLSGGLVVYPGNIPAIGSDFGYLANTNLVIKLDFRLRGIGNNANLYFHSTNEAGNVTMFTGLWSPNFTDIINGFIIIQSLIYTQFSVVPVDSAISLGEYVVSDQTPDIFLIDESGLLLDLYTNYNYSPDLLSYLIVNPYKIIFSGNIQHINQSGAPGTPMTFIDTGGGSNSNPAVYSSAALVGLGVPLLSATYEVYISVTLIGLPPIGMTASFGAAGQTGNDPVTGNYYVAQDNSNGLGFVTILNTAITTSGVGTSSLEFKANPIFSILNGTGYDSSGFNGISLEIKTTQIELVTITDNSSILSSIALPPTPIAPFLGNYFNPPNTQGSTETCTGMFPGGPLGNFTNNAPYYNDLVFGGSI
jgi:PKD repeat protein